VVSMKNGELFVMDRALRTFFIVLAYTVFAIFVLGFVDLMETGWAFAAITPMMLTIIGLFSSTEKWGERRYVEHQDDDLGRLIHLYKFLRADRNNLLGKASGKDYKWLNTWFEDTYHDHFEYLKKTDLNDYPFYLTGVSVILGTALAFLVGFFL
jgi:hypothetical protein